MRRPQRSLPHPGPDPRTRLVRAAAIAVVALSTLAGSCREPAAPRSAPPPPWTPEPPARIPDVARDSGYALRTAGLRYQLRRVPRGLAVELPYSFQNDGVAPVYVTSCRGAARPEPVLALEKEVTPGKWVHAWVPLPDPACDTVALVVAPGERVQDTLRVLAALARDSTLPSFSAPPPEGVYRLAWDALASFDRTLPWLGPGLPARWRQSNRFVLDPPE